MPPALRHHLAQRVVYRDPSGPVPDPLLQQRLQGFLTLWGIPPGRQAVRAEWSVDAPPRLGELDLEQQVIRLNGAYLVRHPELLSETLCHQAAHWAVERFARRGHCDPRVTWLSLMQRAGYQGRVHCARCIGPVTQVPPRARTHFGRRGCLPKAA